MKIKIKIKMKVKIKGWEAGGKRWEEGNVDNSDLRYPFRVRRPDGPCYVHNNLRA